MRLSVLDSIAPPISTFNQSLSSDTVSSNEHSDHSAGSSDWSSQPSDQGGWGSAGGEEDFGEFKTGGSVNISVREIHTSASNKLAAIKALLNDGNMYKSSQLEKGDITNSKSEEIDQGANQNRANQSVIPDQFGKNDLFGEEQDEANFRQSNKNEAFSEQLTDNQSWSSSIFGNQSEKRNASDQPLPDFRFSQSDNISQSGHSIFSQSQAVDVKVNPLWQNGGTAISQSQQSNAANNQPDAEADDWADFKSHDTGNKEGRKSPK